VGVANWKHGQYPPGSRAVEAESLCIIEALGN
jgi:hypothetical protein